MIIEIKSLKIMIFGPNYLDNMKKILDLIFLVREGPLVQLNKGKG